MFKYEHKLLSLKQKLIHHVNALYTINNKKKILNSSNTLRSTKRYLYKRIDSPVLYFDIQ